MISFINIFLLLFYILKHAVANLGCNFTMLEELPTNTFIPLPLGKGELNLFEGFEYFKIVEQPQELISSKFYDEAPIWLPQNLDLFSSNSLSRLQIIQPIDREKICNSKVSNTICDCRRGNSDPRHNSNHNCQFNLRYTRQTDLNGLEIVQLTVCIADINDVQPYFNIPFTNKLTHRGSKLVYDLNIEEESSPDKMYSLPLAKDTDSEPFNNIQSYSLKCRNMEGILLETSKFRLYFNKTEESLKLQVVERLDAEDVDSLKGWPLSCDLTASDGVHSGTLELRISLIDINDHSPEFTDLISLDSRVKLTKGNDYWALELPEDLPGYTNILQIRSIDKDSAFNSIKYSLEIMESRFEPGKFNAPPFKIDPVSGILKLNAPLSYIATKEPVLIFKITAVDNGERSSNLELRVFLKDLNDHPPEISISGISGVPKPRVVSQSGQGTLGSNKYHSVLMDPLKVREELSTELTLAIFKITDADSPENGNATCVFFDSENQLQNRINLKRLAGDVWVLIASGPIDRDVMVPNDRHQYSNKSFTQIKTHILCKDNPTSGQTSLEHKLSILIAVEDINDNPPNFLRIYPSIKDEAFGSLPLIEASIFENAPNGTDILRIQITDKDVADTISYEISDLKKRVPGQVSSSEILTVDQRTGMLRSKQVFDRESVAYYDNILITIKDSLLATNGHVIRARVNLTILDVNDSRPRFLELHQVVQVPEDIVPGETIATIKVTDDDLGQNASITLQVAQQPYSSFFKLKPNSNELILAQGGKKLDREVKSQHEIVLLASDQGFPFKLTATTTLTVMVQDVNDNPPVFPVALKHKPFHLSCSTQGTVDSIEAQDRDTAPEFSVINYKILSVVDSLNQNAQEKTGLNVSELFNIDETTGLLTYHDPTMSCGDRLRVLYIQILAYDPENNDLNDTIRIKVIIDRDPPSTYTNFINETDQKDAAKREAINGYPRGNLRGRGLDWDGTVYGVVILVCVSVGLCLFLVVLLIYFRRRFLNPNINNAHMNCNFRPISQGNITESLGTNDMTFTGIHQNMLVKEFNQDFSTYSKVGCPNTEQLKSMGYSNTDNGTLLRQINLNNSRISSSQSRAASTMRPGTRMLLSPITSNTGPQTVQLYRIAGQDENHNATIFRKNSKQFELVESLQLSDSSTENVCEAENTSCVEKVTQNLRQRPMVENPICYEGIRMITMNDINQDYQALGPEQIPQDLPKEMLKNNRPGIVNKNKMANPTLGGFNNFTFV